VLLKADYEEGGGFLENLKALDQTEGYTSYACLGDYNGIVAFQLQVDDPYEIPREDALTGQRPLLRCVERKNKALTGEVQGVQFSTPLYVIRNWGDSGHERERSRVEAFWADTEKPFFCVTSIYLPAECTVDYAQAQALRGGVDERGSIERLLRDAVKKHKLTCEYLTYFSLQIAEAVVVWKADKLADVVKALQYLYGSFTGYTRTICAAPLEKLLGGNGRWPEKTKADPRHLLTVHVTSKSYHGLQWLRYNKDSPFRRAIDSNEGAKMRDYFTQGYDNYMGFSMGASDRMFYRLLKTLLDALGDRSFTDTVAHLQTTFGIRLAKSGIAASPLQLSAQSEAPPLQGIAYKIYQQMRELMKDGLIRRQPWFNELAVQGQRLLQMSRSCVLDSVCFLLLDSTEFFCGWLLELKKNPKKACSLLDQQAIVTNIFEYFSGWSRLATHMIRSDAIMQVHPSTPPPIDNFCTGMVEYCYTFFYRATDFLRKIEVNDSHKRDPRGFAHMLVPVLERIVKTSECLADEENLTKGRSSSLLRLEVPYQDISEPYFMVGSLVHEAGHYFGERLRERRREIMQDILVLMLANRFRLSDEEAVGQYLYRQLGRFLKVGHADIKDVEYLAILKKMSEEAVVRLVSTSNTQKYLRKHSRLTKEAFDNAVGLLLSPVYPVELTAGYTVLQTDIKLFSYFLKECHADTMMVYTLGLSFERYLRMFLYSSEYRFEPKFESTGRLLKARLKQRIFLVKETLCRLGLWEGEECGRVLGLIRGEVTKNAEMPAFEKGAWLECLLYLESGGMAGDTFPQEILRLIMTYLEECLGETMKTCDANPQLREERECLREQFKTVVLGDRLLDSDFRAFIYKGRKDMLERMTEAFHKAESASGASSGAPS